MLTSCLTVAALCLAVGCTQPADSLGASTSNKAWPAPLADPLGWRILPNIRFAIFSAADPRDHDVTFACSSGGGPLRIFYNLAPNAPREGRLVLAAGNVSHSFAAELSEVRATPPPDGSASVTPGELQGVTAAANVPPDHPVIVEFLRTGELSVDWAGRTLRLDAGAQDRRDLVALWSDCARPATVEPLQPPRIMEAPERPKTS